jgi:hypothetical protein
MTSQPSNGPNRPGASPPTEIDWSGITFLALGLFALLLPYICVPYVGLYGASAVAVVVFLAWAAVMPISCIGGHLLGSLVAMVMFFSTVALAVASLVRFVVSLAA